MYAVGGYRVHIVIDSDMPDVCDGLTISGGNKMGLRRTRGDWDERCALTLHMMG